MSIAHCHIWRSGQDQCLSADRSVESSGEIEVKISYLHLCYRFFLLVFLVFFCCVSRHRERERRERKIFCAKYFGMFISASVIMNFVLACFVLHLCLHTVPVSSALEFPFRVILEVHCVACIHELDFSSTPWRKERHICR